MRIEDERTIKKLVMILVIILLISAFMWLSSCNASSDEMCGTCRVYEYEYNSNGEFRKIAAPYEKLFCGDLYKSSFELDTLEDNYIRQTQIECF